MKNDGGTVVHEDPRPILYAERLLSDADGDTLIWTTKKGRWQNCDEIRAYQEAGVGAMETWLAVYKNGEVVARLPARFHEIGYAMLEAREVGEES